MIGMVKRAKPLAKIVIIRACAILPPAAAVMTTAPLTVVGMAATRNRPTIMPKFNGDQTKRAALTGAAKNMTAKAIKMTFISIASELIWRVSKIKPELQCLFVFATP